MDGRADVRRRNIDVRAVARFRGMRRCSGDARDTIINSQRTLSEFIAKRDIQVSQLPRDIFDVPTSLFGLSDFKKNERSFEHRNEI